MKDIKMKPTWYWSALQKLEIMNPDAKKLTSWTARGCDISAWHEGRGEAAERPDSRTSGDLWLIRFDKPRLNGPPEKQNPHNPHIIYCVNVIKSSHPD